MQGAIGAAIGGGTGLAAALPDNAKTRRWVGAASLVSAVYAAAAAFLATRNNERFSARQCGAVLGADLQNKDFQRVIDSLRIITLDSAHAHPGKTDSRKKHDVEKTGPVYHQLER
jgi:hypothetical protein